jgi:7,8-dihydropterin-6-yl-methyl-4-(beta-D-ribofuranosyl)aminobenzene 5'-phosphate synthase
VLVVGCSHPGIERIVEAATSIDTRIHLIAGGLHLVVSSDPDIEKVVTALHDKFKVDYIAPGHCTGEPAFVALKKAFGDRYLFAGLGDSIHLTGSPNQLP